MVHWFPGQSSNDAQDGQLEWRPAIKVRTINTRISADDLTAWLGRLQPIANPPAVFAAVTAADIAGLGTGQYLPAEKAGRNEQHEATLFGQRDLDAIDELAGRPASLDDEQRRAIALAKMILQAVHGVRVEKGYGKDGVIKKVLEDDATGKLGGQVALRNSYDRFFGSPPKGKPTRRSIDERLERARSILDRFAA
ncbi:hypothetical protein UB31_09720 [Bradyrhizobium sp. LTSP849]|nr:hypothetical protein UB31_09720 [Bradyrhizobium sp. LTSP849]